MLIVKKKSFATMLAIVLTLCGYPLKAMEKVKEESKDDRSLLNANLNANNQLFECSTYLDLLPTDIKKLLKEMLETHPIFSISPLQPLYTLTGHTGAVISAEFNQQDTLVITASSDGSAKIWDARRGLLVTSLNGHTDKLNSAHFNQEGNRAVTASDDGRAKIWNIPSGKLVATLTGHTGKVVSAEFNQQGNFVVTASHDKTAQIWDAITGICKVILTGHMGAVNSAQFNRKGNLVVTASDDCTAKIWSSETGLVLTTLVELGAVVSAQFNGQDSLVMTASSSYATLWDFGKMTTPLLPKVTRWENGRSLLGGLMSDLAAPPEFNQQGDRVITGQERDGLAVIYDALTGYMIGVFNCYWGCDAADVNSARFNRNGTMLLTVCDHYYVHIWDVTKGKKDQWDEYNKDYIALCHCHEVTSARFNHQGNSIVTASRNGTSTIFQLYTPIRRTLKQTLALLWPIALIEKGVRNKEIPIDQSAIILQARQLAIQQNIDFWDALIEYCKNLKN